MSVRILQGDCRDVLKTLDAESVHCVITSPPYWGLRDYKIPPTIWAYGPQSHEHEWGDELRVRDGSGFQGKMAVAKLTAKELSSAFKQFLGMKRTVDAIKSVYSQLASV